VEVKQEPKETKRLNTRDIYIVTKQYHRDLALARYKGSGNNKRGVRNKSNSIRC